MSGIPIGVGAAAAATAIILVMAAPSAAAEQEALTGEAGSTFSSATQSIYTPAGVASDEPAAVPPAQQAAVLPAEPAAVPPAKKEVGVKTGPSEWEGRKLRHPDGGKFPNVVLRWANLVRAVMQEHDIPERHLEGILAQIQQESFGDPNAVNNWDINAVNGDPSKGLLQVIGETYQQHAKKGFEARKYQNVPYTNIHSALNYVKVTYGMSKFKSWNNGGNQGY
jgi:hypothetical protein